MTASDALLHRIERDPSLAATLAWPVDFDIARRDPVEDLVLPSGERPHPVAGCGAGGTYFLCGKAESGQRPVLYADSEGRATLVGADLAEALTLITVLPFWRDLAKGLPLGELGSELRADHPDFDVERDRLLHALGLTPVPEEEAVARLLAVAARTAPDCLPRVPDSDHQPYEPLFEGEPA